MNHRLAHLLAPALAAALLASCQGANGPAPDKEYKVTVRYCPAATFSSCTSDPSTQATLDDVPQNVRDAYDAAAARVLSLITAGITPSSTGSLMCGDPKKSSIYVQMHDETVHGLLLLVTVDSLSGSTIASSGPCIVRLSNHLPLVALSIYNRADLGYSPKTLGDVAFHEMLHTLGFGTVWTDFSPSLISGAWTADTGFRGSRAVHAVIADNNGLASWSKVPLEYCGYSDPAPSTCWDDSVPDNSKPAICCIGTRDSHWLQSLFGLEMMTGGVNPSSTETRPLSATTLASLADIGYSVDMSKAEAFSLPTTGVRALVSEPLLDLSHDVLELPPAYADDTVPVE